MYYSLSLLTLEEESRKGLGLGLFVLASEVIGLLVVTQGMTEAAVKQLL